MDLKKDSWVEGCGGDGCAVLGAGLLMGSTEGLAVLLSVFGPAGLSVLVVAVCVVFVEWFSTTVVEEFNPVLAVAVELAAEDTFSVALDNEVLAVGLTGSDTALVGLGSGPSDTIVSFLVELSEVGDLEEVSTLAETALSL